MGDPTVMVYREDPLGPVPCPATMNFLPSGDQTG